MPSSYSGIGRFRLRCPQPLDEMNILLSMLLVAGLIGPGWGWARGANWPAAGLAAGFISALAILGGVVGFSLIGVPLTLGTMAAWLGIVALGGGWFYQRRAGGAAESGNWSQWRLALPVLPLIAVAAWRAH